MNPELRRHLWLEATPHRLLLLPAVILAAAALLPRSPGSGVALLAFALFTLLWGARLAADTIAQELRERTWDIQRMAALDPWPMTWGKLAGATSMAWYGGAWCALVYVWLAAPGEHVQHLQAVLATAAAALAAQALALTAALLGLRLARQPRSRLFGSLLLLGLALTLPALFDLLDPGARISWYGWSLGRLDFVSASTLAAAAWAVTCAYRRMCEELQVRTRPWLWPLFSAFMSLYLLGFAAATPTAAGAFAWRLASTAAAVACVQSYVAAFALPLDPLGWRRLRAAAARGAWRELAEETPLWAVSALLAVACALAATGAGGAPDLSGSRIDNLGAGALAFAGMMLRDVAILHCCAVGRRGERAVATALIYIGSLDVLLPALCEQFGWDMALALLMPSPLAAPVAAAWVFALHAALAWSLAVWLWRRRAGLSRAGDRRS